MSERSGSVEVGVELEGGGNMRGKNDMELGSLGSSEEEESLLDEAGRSCTVSPTLHGGKEEKSPSPSIPNVIITPSRQREEKHSDNALRQSPSPRLARLATPDPDIQLADPAPLPVASSKSTLHSMCGPKPTKVAIICLVVVSIWATWVLVIHLNKKMDLLNEAVSQSTHKIKAMDDAAMLFRSKSANRMQRIQKELELAMMGALDQGSTVTINSAIFISTSIPKPGTTIATNSHDIKSTTKGSTIAFNSPIVTATTQGCPDSWILYGKYCYQISNTYESWDTALYNCRKIGGELASIASSDELTFMEKIEKLSFWVGGTDMEKYGTWKWTDNTPWTLLSQKLWSKGDPDNDEHCAYVSAASPGNIKSDDCNNGRKAICKSMLGSGSLKSPVLPSVNPVQSVPFNSNNQNSHKILQTELPSTTPQTADQVVCTESGDSCVFPFTYKGVTHQSCVQAWTDIKPWCATNTGPQGQFLKDSWSYCQKCS